MSKRTVTRLFGGSLVALAAGLVLLFVAGGLAYANGSFIMDGSDVVGVRSTPFGWSMLAAAGLMVLAIVAALIAQFAAWIGALMNTAQLEDKTWFVVLLVAGLLSFGFIAMLIYIIAGPNDRRPPQPIKQQRTGSPAQRREPVG
jgi:hypothetical protein